MISFCGEEKLLDAQALHKLTRDKCDSFYLLNRFMNGNYKIDE